MTYETRELWVAACIELDGRYVTDIIFNDRNQATFIFDLEEEDDYDPKEIEDGYFSNKLKVAPQELRNKVRELSTRLKREKEKAYGVWK